MENYTRSDLACELTERAGKLEGVEENEENNGFCRVHTVKILTEEASRKIGKPIGTYKNFDCGKILHLSEEEKRQISLLLSSELRKLAKEVTQKAIDGDFSVFVVGLGNAELTVDAVGPLTVSHLTATRHLKVYEPELYRSLECSSLAAFAPGVLGQTGIEVADLVHGALKSVSPDLLIVIDALAAKSCDRLSSTIQLSDSGIVPGSGVCNHRNAIDRESMGIPVLSVGVPTVVDSATLVYDALEKAGITELDPALSEVLETGKSFFVSPKDCDRITAQFSHILSQALDFAFAGDFSL